jgi:hypothetical protein
MIAGLLFHFVWQNVTLMVSLDAIAFICFRKECQKLICCRPAPPTACILGLHFREASCIDLRPLSSWTRCKNVPFFYYPYLYATLAP